MKKKNIRKLEKWEIQWKLSSLKRTIQQHQFNLITPQQLETIAQLERQLGDK